MITKDLLQQYQDELKEIQDEYEAFNAKRDLQLPVVQENLKNARLRAARASETFNELVQWFKHLLFGQAVLGFRTLSFWLASNP